MTLDDIKRAFEPGAFARGLAYADEGRVLSVTEPEPGIIDATVRGSGGVRYAPSIVLGARRTRGRWVEADCDCPVGFNCKHAAAALIVFARKSMSAAAAAASAVAEPVLPAALANWLAALELADRPAVETTAGYPDTVRDRLLYVADIASGRRLTVTPVKATLRKDGSWSKNPRAYDIARLGWGPRPQFVLDSDLSLCGRLGELGLLLHGG